MLHSSAKALLLSCLDRESSITRGLLAFASNTVLTAQVFAAFARNPVLAAQISARAVSNQDTYRHQQ